MLKTMQILFVGLILAGAAISNSEAFGVMLLKDLLGCNSYACRISALESDVATLKSQVNRLMGANDNGANPSSDTNSGNNAQPSQNSQSSNNGNDNGQSTTSNNNPNNSSNNSGQQGNSQQQNNAQNSSTSNPSGSNSSNNSSPAGRSANLMDVFSGSNRRRSSQSFQGK